MKRLLLYCALCFSLCSIGTNGFAQTGDAPIKEPRPVPCPETRPIPCPAPKPCPAPRPEPKVEMSIIEANKVQGEIELRGHYYPVDPVEPLIHRSDCWKCRNLGLKVPRPRWYDQERLLPHCGLHTPYLPEEESNYYIIVR